MDKKSNMSIFDLISKVKHIHEVFLIDKSEAPKLTKGNIVILNKLVQLTISLKDPQLLSILHYVLDIIQQSLIHSYTQEEWNDLSYDLIKFTELIFKIFCDNLDRAAVNDPMKNNHLIQRTASLLLPLGKQTNVLKHLFLKGLTNLLLTLISSNKLHFEDRKRIFLIYKPILLKSGETQFRIELMKNNPKIFIGLVNCLLTCGDYETQELIVEVLIRYADKFDKENSILKEWFAPFPDLIHLVDKISYLQFHASILRKNRSISSSQ